VLIIAGIGLLGVSASWTWLSQEFVYGEAHAERPILEYLALYFAGWIAFLVGFLAVAGRKVRASLALILFIGVGARLLLLPSSLIQENDVYRYVLDGQVILHGGNPFEFSPLVVAELASDNLRQSLELPEAQLVLQRVGYPEVSTIYPPMAQAAFAAGAALTGWDWMGQRVVFLITDSILMLVLVLVLRKLALSPAWLLIYAWNPLILKEIMNSAHLDVLVALFLVCLIYGLLQYGRVPAFLWLAFAATSLGLAILSKLYPVLLLPACLLFLVRKGVGWKGMVYFSGITAGIVVLGYLPFLSVDFACLTAGLSTYSNHWRMNDGVFSIISLFLSYPRLVTGALIAIIALVLPIFRGSRSGEELAVDFHWILLLWFLLIPTPYPWYAVPLVAIAAIRPVEAPSLTTIVLSGMTGLYYLSFFFEYQEYAGSWWIWTRVVEHSIIWCTILVAIVFVPTMLKRRQLVVNDSKS